jgi:DNA topoisomerase IA
MIWQRTVACADESAAEFERTTVEIEAGSTAQRTVGLRAVGSGRAASTAFIAVYQEGRDDVPKSTPGRGRGRGSVACR